jgi:ribonucleoside-triphosphate reductase
MFEKSSISQAVNSVYKTLQNQLIKTYGIEVEESEIITDQILKVHGMSKEDFSVIDKIEKLVSGKLNDVSVDDNSNKGEKTIKGIMKEAMNPFEKMTGYRFLYRKMAEIYGKKEAKHLTSLMYDFTLGLSDSTNILVPYCWAFDASKLVTMGKPFGQLPSSPVKRLDSYVSLLNEVVHTLSNHLAGAIAVGTFFIDIAHLLLMREGKTIENLSEAEYRKLIKNQYQRVVHGFNSLSRSGGTESPFTNISLFDRDKLDKLVKEEYSWYFMNEDGTYTHDLDYVISFILELQNIFMEFFDKGDPMNDGMPYRFPVATLNISKKKDKEGKWIIEDRQFLKQACKKDIYRYNIFVSEGNKVASCCRLINDTEMMGLASQANSFGAGGSISLGSHRVVTLNFARYALMSKSYDEFLELIKLHTNNAKKILKAHKQLLKDSKHSQLFLQIGWVQLERMFSTLGIMGYVEAEEILKKKFGKQIESKDIMKDFLDYFNNEVNINNENFEGCFFNVEQIPGESMAHRLPRVDKLLFSDKLIPYNLYANQFIPLWDTTHTVWEKMEIDGKYLMGLTGGGISHVNTGEHLTSKQAERVINYAVENNCEHFAITGTFCQCEVGHVIIGNRETCAKCGGVITKKISRVVGFFVQVKDMSTYKKEFDHDIRKEYSNGDFDYADIQKA